MQEICQSGSEGGAKRTFVPTPIREQWTRPGGTVDLLTSPVENIILFCFFVSPETDERRMTHLQETLINRPYGTGRVFFLFSRHFVPGRLRRLRRARQPGVCATTLCGRDVGFAESGYPRFNPSGINA